MFEYIKGQLADISSAYIVIENGGLGYQIHIPINCYGSLPAPGEEIFLYLSKVIREDSHKLFGFPTKTERDLFNKLTDLSGMGPKTALSLLGHLNESELEKAILENNSSSLFKVPGIGKKTAERLIIDLKDYFSGKKISPVQSSHKDSVQALINLGYHRSKAEKAVAKAAEVLKDPNTSSLIKTSLKLITHG